MALNRTESDRLPSSDHREPLFEAVSSEERQRIHDDNVRLHGASAEYYDSVHPHMRNRFEQDLQRRDIRTMVDSIRPRTSAVRVLEIGCGTGNLTVEFLRRGCVVVGIDLSAEMVAVLRRKLTASALQDRADLRIQGVEQFLEHPDGRFDIVAMSSVAHHLPDYVASLTSLGRLITNGGMLYLIHEPAHRNEMARRALPLRRAWSVVPRALDRVLVNIGSRNTHGTFDWNDQDTRFADFHYHRDGVSVAAIQHALSEHGFSLTAEMRYNAHRTSAASWLDNRCCPGIRYEQFQRTYFRAIFTRDAHSGEGSTA